MKEDVKSRTEILKKLGIDELNQMQVEAINAIDSYKQVILLSPTGSGKTLAFLLPLIYKLKQQAFNPQALILTPTRELALQIEQVARDLGLGFKVTAIYGGKSKRQENDELKTIPSILIGTPGRLADHFFRESISAKGIDYIVLDEFDKILEIGFEDEMKYILETTNEASYKILTSATPLSNIPSYTGLKSVKKVDFLNDNPPDLKYSKIISADKDKLKSLLDTLKSIGTEPTIVFLNYRQAIERVSSDLTANQISHGIFHGGMDQKDRERSLMQFRNGTHTILLATDLASRGINIPAIKYIIHYHQPDTEDQFIHRNGRTARMHQDGSIIMLLWENEVVKPFIPQCSERELVQPNQQQSSQWTTLYISGGRKDKISKSDIAGFFIKQGQLKPEELGLIELKHDCSFVAVSKDIALAVISKLNNQRLKKKKVRLTLI